MSSRRVHRLVGAAVLLTVIGGSWVGVSVYEDRAEHVRNRSTGEISEVSVICNSVIAGGDVRDELPSGVELVSDACKESGVRRVWFGLGILAGGAWVGSVVYVRRRRVHS